MQDAINTIVGIMDCFPQIYKFSIIEKNNISIHLTDFEINEKQFNNSIVLLEWCEENLEKRTGKPKTE